MIARNFCCPAALLGHGRTVIPGSQTGIIRLSAFFDPEPQIFDAAFDVLVIDVAVKAKAFAGAFCELHHALNTGWRPGAGVYAGFSIGNRQRQPCRHIIFVRIMLDEFHITAFFRNCFCRRTVVKPPVFFGL